MFVDTHTHIYTSEFDTDREEAVARALDAGALHLLLPNIDEASIAPMMDLYHAHPEVCHPMMGLHPTELPADPRPLLDKMEQMLTAPSHPFVAVGEVGIDLYWDDSRKAEQIDTFRRQAEWAVAYDLPLMIHARKAHRLIVDTLSDLRDDLTGVFHCFSGSREEAEELMRRFPGFVFGIGGVLTFKKAHLPEVLRTTVPLERIVTETDAPYLAPTPHRGHRNEPAYVPLIIDHLCAIYDLPRAETETRLVENALRVFPKIAH